MTVPTTARVWLGLWQAWHWSSVFWQGKGKVLVEVLHCAALGLPSPLTGEYTEYTPVSLHKHS